MEEKLERCKDELKALKEENKLLRQAASSFGDLAERLSHQMEIERRQSATDRRGIPRDAPDRRQHAADSP